MSKLELDEELVRKLSALLDENDLTEIEVEAGDHRIRVARSLQIAAAPAVAPAVAAAAAPAASDGDTVPAGSVIAPMVGTVYVAPEPGASPFVKVGDTVTEGETIAIIEAMKVMNQIPSPRAGRISQVLVRDGQPIEYGEPIMVIE